MSFKLKNPTNNENQHLSLSKKIEIEQQKLAIYEQRIASLEQRKEFLREDQQRKEMRLIQLKQDIKKHHQLDNPIVKQLREHFKALRDQLGELMYEDEDQDIQIDNMTYEELLELQERIGNVSKGLTSQKFEQLDRFQYINDYNIQEECSICRDQFEEQQRCVRLGCKHFFHQECVKKWCSQQKVCPNCKTEIS